MCLIALNTVVVKLQELDNRFFFVLSMSSRRQKNMFARVTEGHKAKMDPDILPQVIRISFAWHYNFLRNITLVTNILFIYILFIYINILYFNLNNKILYFF